MPSCWFCDAAIPAAQIHEHGYLSPRSGDEGGPLWLFGCPSCGHAVGAERNAAGDFLLVPVESLGLAARLAGVFDREKLMLRAHALAWYRDNAERRDTFHAVEPRRCSDGPAPDPPPRHDSDSKEHRQPTGNRETPPRNDETLPPAEPTPIAEAYRRLELEPASDREAVTEAFRRLSKLCHPDKVAHLDADFQELAHRKFKALKEAYDELMTRSE